MDQTQKSYFLWLLIGLVPASVWGLRNDIVVVYDITSTLQVNQQTIRSEVPGFVNGTVYAISHWTTKPSEAIEQDFRGLLASFGKQQGNAEQMVRDPEGRPVSEMLVQWLSGYQTSAQLVQRIGMYAEYAIFRDIARTVFNDAIIAKHTYVMPSMLHCIEQCAQHISPQRFYLIGNWDSGSFALLSRMPHAATVFTRIAPHHRFISGNTHLLMPRDATRIFQQIATDAQVALDHIIFVSNMPHHISAAQRSGVHAVALLPQNMGLTIQTILGLLRG